MAKIFDKKVYFTIAVLIVVSVAVSLIYFRSPLDFNYLSLGCRIYTADGKIVVGEDRSYLCAFNSEGYMLQLGGGLYSPKGDLLLPQQSVVHHDFKFSGDNRFTLAIEAEDAQIGGRLLKVDCAVRRDFKGKVDAKWCLDDHLQELADAGYFFEEWSAPAGYSNQPEIKSTSEISHANSLFEIPENTLGRSDPAFAKGNYLFNLYGPSNYMVIIDREMKKTLKVFSMGQFPFPAHIGNPRFLEIGKKKLNFRYQSMIVHDSQVLPDGYILSYGSQLVAGPSEFFPTLLRQSLDKSILMCSAVGSRGWPRASTVIFKWNPLRPDKDLKIIWVGSGTKSVSEPIRGSVVEMKNGHYLVLDNEGGKSRIFVINSNGEQLWEFKNFRPGSPVFAVRPLYDLDYLRSRGILN